MRVETIRLADAAGGPPRLCYAVVDETGAGVRSINRFLFAAHRDGRAANTIRAYAYDLLLYWQFLGAHALDWQTLTSADLDPFWADLQRLPAGPPPKQPPPGYHRAASCQRLHSTIAQFYRFYAALQPGIAALSPAPLPTASLLARATAALLIGDGEYSVLPRRRWRHLFETAPPPALSQEQVIAVLQVCQTLRDYFLIVLLYTTGLRIGEALGLRHQDIDVVGGWIHVVPRENSNCARAKGGTHSSVPVAPELLVLYREYIQRELGPLAVPPRDPAAPVAEDRDYVFVDFRDATLGDPLKYSVVVPIFAALGRAAGVPFHAHRFRHAYATHMALQKVALPLVQRLLRHKTLASTLHYINPDAEAMRATNRAFWEQFDPQAASAPNPAPDDDPG